MFEMAINLSIALLVLVFGVATLVIMHAEKVGLFTRLMFGMLIGGVELLLIAGPSDWEWIKYASAVIGIAFAVLLMIAVKKREDGYPIPPYHPTVLRR
jgi:peptidoglycan/LPS O-acetylase OafA/YrhL